MSDRSWLEDDLSFERQLLAAGRAEALPPDQTAAALLRFTTGLAAVTTGVNGNGAGAEPTPGMPATSSAHLAANAKWLALGALGGSLTTFAWLQHDAQNRATRAPAAPASASPASLTPPASPASRTPAPAALSATVVGSTVEPRRAAVPVEPKTTLRPGAVHVARTSTTSASAVAPSTLDLAAEVAALDGVRTAMSIGAWQHAERQLADYRRNFPRGAMRREAEVLSLDVLVAQGQKAAAASAAQRFIAEHPRDPQVPRMRAFLE